MTITAEQAQAELQRRAGAKTSGVTAGQAQAELERRRSAGSQNEPGLMQQLFDVKNPDTGESYLYGNTPAPTQFEDLQRTVGDTASRGYLDKLRGPEAQARTAAARERMPDWVETPMDIATAVGASPYRIGSTLAGAGFGALEGAASAYGHQKDWIPDAGEAWDIVKGAGVGTATGAAGAKAGEWLGGARATSDARAARPYKSETDFNVLAPADQVADVATINASRGATRDDFATQMAGLQNASPEVQAMIAEITGGKGLTQTVAGLIPESVTGGGLNRTLLTALTLGPKAAAARVGAQGLKAAGESDWANRVPDKAIDALAELQRNGPLRIDPATIDKWRDVFAKAGIGYGRSP